jgi:tripartite-type tricarboxylate transporter receptor subunit TctC
MKRRTLLGALALPLAARAAEWPERPVRVIMPYAAGGPTDIICRLLCDRLSQRLPQRFVVENRTGGGGVIAAGLVAKAEADGHTLLFSNIGHAVLGALYASMDFNPARDFRAITIIAESPMVLLVPPNAPWRTLAEFVAAVKAAPGRYGYVSAGGGGALQLASLLFLREAGLRMEEIAYRGSAPAVPDLAAGSVAMMYDAAATGFQLARNGQARALAVSSAQRSAVAPEVPTIGEAGYPGASFAVWQCFLAPRAVPDAVVARLHTEIAAILAEEPVRRRMADLGAERLIGNPPAEAEAFLQAETAKWAAILREAGVRPQ